MSDNVAVVTVKPSQCRGRRIKRPDIYCHLITGRRHEKEVISEKRFKRRGEMAARERKNTSGRQREKEKKTVRGRREEGNEG